MNLDRVSVWKRYIYLPWQVRRDICLMTFKCTLERLTVYSHWTCTHSTAAVPTAALSADVAGCTATCDVDKTSSTHMTSGSQMEEKRILSVATDHWLWLIDSTTDMVRWRFWTCINDWHAGTSQHRWQGDCYSCAPSLSRGYRFQYITTAPNNARDYCWGG